MIQKKTVGILIFPDVELLDFCGPHEVLSVTRLEEERRREEPSPFKVLAIAEKTDAISASGGLRVIPDCELTECPNLDILLLPGGWGVRREISNEPLLRWIADRGKRAELLTSVCTGSMLLGHAGLLEGKRATTHWSCLEWMRESFPGVTVEDRLHVVEDGDLVTSAGISAGIDLALRIVARYHGEAVARRTARYMEYPYPENNARRI